MSIFDFILRRDFACCAIGVLDLSFSQSDLRVYDVLNRKDPNLNDLTVIELAYNSDNKDFLSHPCCQKWITNKFNGSISVREFNLGMFEMPTWTKVLIYLKKNALKKIYFSLYHICVLF